MFDNQMTLSFPSKSVNEGLARMAVGNKQPNNNALG